MKKRDETSEFFSELRAALKPRKDPVPTPRDLIAVLLLGGFALVAAICVLVGRALA